MRFSQGSGDGDRRQPAAFLLEPQGPPREVPGLVGCDPDLLRRDHGGHLPQALFVHRLRKDRVGLAERIDAVDQVDVEIAHIHDEPPHTVDQGRTSRYPSSSSPSPSSRSFQGDPLRFLRQVQRGDRVLADRFLVPFVELGELLLDDLSHPHLGQLLGQKLLVEEPAFDRDFVLHEGGDHLGQVFLADACGRLALRLRQPLDLDGDLTGLFVNPHVASARVVALLAVVEPFDRPAGLRFRREVEARSEHLLHEEARRDRLERVVHRLGDGLLGGIRLRDEIREASPGFPRGVARGAADDLHDLGQARSVTDGQRVIAPDPVKAFLRHSKGDDDVHMVPVVLLPGIPECGGDPVPPSGVVVDEVGYPEHAPAGGLHQLKAGLGIRPLPLA